MNSLAAADAIQPPVWLLDVDGVVNASRPGWGGAPRKVHVWSPSDSSENTVSWAPPLVDRIRVLHNTGRVEVRWCSSWCADADVLERLWRLPALERAFTEPFGLEAAARVKIASARQVINDGRRLIWTDDTAVPISGELFDELTKGGRALLIRPNGRRGLQPGDLDAIETFAKANTPKGASDA